MYYYNKKVYEYYEKHKDKIPLKCKFNSNLEFYYNDAYIGFVNVEKWNVEYSIQCEDCFKLKGSQLFKVAYDRGIKWDKSNFAKSVIETYIKVVYCDFDEMRLMERLMKDIEKSGILDRRKYDSDG